MQPSKTTVTVHHSDQLVAAATRLDFCTAGRTLLTLTTFAGKKNGAWSCHPAKGTLAKLVGVTERTIQTCIQQLAELGLISITHRKGGANLYSFNAERILKPTSAIISTLNPMSQRTRELAERVQAAEKRRADIAEKYFRKVEKPASPGGEKQDLPPAAGRGDRRDLPNKGFETRSQIKNNPADAGTPPLSKEPAQAMRTGTMTRSMLRMCWDASLYQLTKITDLIRRLIKSNGPSGDLEQAKCNLHKEQQTLAGYAQRAVELGYDGFELPDHLIA
ncbi:helix-turn-helix domain-containing protein [Aeromonas hydrophila]|uniref:helix-turn-helix domain-containing protein n=1 Tax=Aeromonas hydrophila TaxID=644 RepID=UPI00080A9EA2|nr:helix-turn-helix domain-containing protein [Aeromonas hydrophila]ANT70211.1 hypothetical protein TK34_22320 [Aeromonas hydrophila]